MGVAKGGSAVQDRYEAYSDPNADPSVLLASAFNVRDFWRRVLGVTAPSSAVDGVPARITRRGADDPRDVPPSTPNGDIDFEAELQELETMLAAGRARRVGSPLVAATAERI